MDRIMHAIHWFTIWSIVIRTIHNRVGATVVQEGVDSCKVPTCEFVYITIKWSAGLGRYPEVVPWCRHCRRGGGDDGSVKVKGFPPFRQRMLSSAGIGAVRVLNERVGGLAPSSVCKGGEGELRAGMRKGEMEISARSREWE